MEEVGAEKKDEKENQLKRTKSRELRGGIMYYSCHCIKRNGLQHDCRRTGCGGEPACLTMPDPLCAPSQLARARGLADSAPLAAHMRAQGGGGTAGASEPGSSGGKRFIVCELKGVVPDVSVDKSGKCCKCPVSHGVPIQNTTAGYVNDYKSIPISSNPMARSANCACAGNSSANTDRSLFVFDEQTLKTILKRFNEKEVESKETSRPYNRSQKTSKPVVKEEPCTRPGCVHWKPPPPCLWDAPCKADCFEAHPGIQPGRNPLTDGGGSCVREASDSPGETKSSVGKSEQRPKEKMILLTPECCTGCRTPNEGGASASDNPAAGLPVLVMKLC